jgi:RNA polymerase sigma-70 factor (ECF subfamily)
MTETRDERFARLLRQHGAALARLAAAYEPDPDDREDLMQDLALAIWRALPGYRGDCSERTFVFRIGHNRAITHRAMGRRRRARLDAGADIAELPDPRPDPAGQAATIDRHGRLMAAVHRLTPALREAVVLSLEGLSHQEIADVLGASQNVVAVRLTRARGQLAMLLRTAERP